MSYLVRIYKIIVLTEDEYEPYIGATKQSLSARMSGHRAKYKIWKNGKTHFVSSFHLFEKFGMDNCKIILLNTYTVFSKEEMTMREQEYMDKIKNCNQYKAYITEEEKKEQIKQCCKKYHIENSEIIKEHKKEYRIENSEIIKEHEKEYRFKNSEIIKERKKKWYLQNSEKITCECGAIIRKGWKSQHEKSKKHILFQTESQPIN
jgi:hypothetical protein